MRKVKQRIRERQRRVSGLLEQMRYFPKMVYGRRETEEMKIVKEKNENAVRDLFVVYNNIDISRNVSLAFFSSSFSVVP